MNWDQDFPISELRVVRYRFQFGEDRWTQELMHVSQVQDFVKAKLELHWEPGVNPRKYKMLLQDGATPSQARNGSRAAVMWEIRVSRFDPKQAEEFWHTTPGLGQELSRDGARVLQTYKHDERVWAHPDLLADEKRAEEQE